MTIVDRPSVRRERDLPAPVRLVVLRHWYAVVALEVRRTGSDEETLIDMGGVSTWVPSSRVAYPAGPSPPDASSAS